MEELKNVMAGGIWKEGDLNVKDTWEGDRGSSKAQDSGLSYKPKTRQQEEDEILEEANISSEVLSIISQRVSNSYKRANKHTEVNLEQIMSKFKENFDTSLTDVQKWREKVTQDLAGITEESSAIESMKRDLLKIEERVKNLEYQLELLKGSITHHGPEEARMIHEAYQIIIKRAATEDEGSNVEPEPSVIGQLRDYDQKLTEKLQAIRPITNPDAIPEAVNTSSRSRVLRKFGRLL